MMTPGRLGLYAVVEPSERPLRLGRSLRDPQELVVLEPIQELAFDSDLAAMWIREEISLHRSLALPGVVPLRDFFWAQSSPGQHVFCIAHGYLASHSLDALLAAARRRHEPVPVPVALAIALDVLTAISHVHAARSPDGTRLGMLVRSLTPERILIDAGGRAWLWQPVRRPGGAAADATNLTRFAHLSPESVGGQPVAVTSDLYSVASVLWLMLTGRPRLPDQGLVGLLSALLHAPPAAPSRWRPGLPPALDALVLRCLAREPRARPVDADAMIGELTQLLATLTREGEATAAGAPFRQAARAPAPPDSRVGVAQWASALGAAPWPGPEVYALGSSPPAPPSDEPVPQATRAGYRQT